MPIIERLRYVMCYIYTCVLICAMCNTTTYCIECGFILQLLFLFGTNMAKFAEDINQFRSDDLKIAHFVDELNKVVTTTNKVHA